MLSLRIRHKNKIKTRKNVAVGLYRLQNTHSRQKCSLIYFQICHALNGHRYVHHILLAYIHKITQNPYALLTLENEYNLCGIYLNIHANFCDIFTPFMSSKVKSEKSGEIIRNSYMETRLYDLR